MLDQQQVHDILPQHHPWISSSLLRSLDILPQHHPWISSNLLRSLDWKRAAQLSTSFCCGGPAPHTPRKKNQRKGTSLSPFILSDNGFPVSLPMIYLSVCLCVCGLRPVLSLLDPPFYWIPFVDTGYLLFPPSDFPIPNISPSQYPPARATSVPHLYLHTIISSHRGVGKETCVDHCLQGTPGAT